MKTNPKIVSSLIINVDLYNPAVVFEMDHKRNGIKSKHTPRSLKTKLTVFHTFTFSSWQSNTEDLKVHFPYDTDKHKQRHDGNEEVHNIKPKYERVRRMDNCLIFGSIPPRYRKRRWLTIIMIKLFLTAVHSHLMTKAISTFTRVTEMSIPLVYLLKTSGRMRDIRIDRALGALVLHGWLNYLICRGTCFHLTKQPSKTARNVTANSLRHPPPLCP